MRLIKFILLYIVFSFLIFTKSYSKEPLKECLKKLEGNIGSRFLEFNAIETKNSLYHSFKIWQTYKSGNRSIVMINSNKFLKIDTTGKDNEIAKTYFDKQYLLYQDYGDTVLTPVTKTDIIEENLEEARYSPLGIINYFIDNEKKCIVENDDNYWVYRLKIEKSIVRIFINKSDFLFEKLVELNPHNILGDIENVYHYTNYSNIDDLFYPQKIYIDKTNGKAKDTILISSAKIVDKVESILIKPDNYEFKKEPDNSVNIEFEKFSDNISFIIVKEAQSKSMVVEFKDFLVVIDSPLKSEYGELMINEIRKHFNDKPIKYFSFGHHHSWYIGGIRAFVHKGVTILCNVPEDYDYLKYITDAKRTLEPDSLSINPKPLVIEQIKDSLTISDSKLELKIFLIGKKSDHSQDYMIYYIPSQKLLYQDDLTWISSDGVPKKPGSRQIGLYNAIKDLNINVETVVQSWPTGRDNLKSIFPFKDLEETMKLVK